MMDKVHASHLGIQGSLTRAKEAFYWPGIYKQITEFIARCSICNSYKPEQQKEPASSDGSGIHHMRVTKTELLRPLLSQSDKHLTPLARTTPTPRNNREHFCQKTRT